MHFGIGFICWNKKGLNRIEQYRGLQRSNAGKQVNAQEDLILLVGFLTMMVMWYCGRRTLNHVTLPGIQFLAQLHGCFLPVRNIYNEPWTFTERNSPDGPFPPQI